MSADLASPSTGANTLVPAIGNVPVLGAETPLATVRSAKARQARTAVGKAKGTRRKKAGVGPIPPDYRPPRSDTEPADPMRQPSRHRETILPLVDVGSVGFETLCLAVVRDEFPDVIGESLKRDRGVEQYGVDVEGFDRDRNTAVVVSCKCYGKVNAWDVTLWIREFLEHVEDHWNGKGVRTFVLAVTHAFNDDELNAAAKDCVSQLAAKGIAFHLWNSVRLTTLVARREQLVDRYFGRFWAEAISARPGVGRSATNPASIATSTNALADLLRANLQQAESVAEGEANGEMGARLDEAIRAVRNGRPSYLNRWLADARETEGSWRSLRATNRARALRVAAMVRLQSGDLAGAVTLADEADHLEPPPDRTARAHLLRMMASAEDALGLLREPLTTPERELRAALLIEDGHADQALATLDGFLGSEVTTEVLRLRAVASVALGDRRRARTQADSAVRKGDGLAAPLLTRGIIRLLSALAPGIRPQFGDRPNPIDPDLVIGTEESLRHLDAAADDFSRLAVETEGAFRLAGEAWHLAALVLHPDRSREAIELGRALARRPSPDPIVVAWLANSGILRSRGRIKKAFGDLIRRGEGTATHLIVLALLASGSRNPERGAAVLRRFASRFPRDADLIAPWLTQFGGSPERGESGYAAASRQVVAGGEADRLCRLLSDPAGDVEQLMAGAKALMARRHWRALDGLRTRILAIGNRQASEIAARAALGNDAPEDCLAILRGAEASSSPAPLPRPLIFLRIQANDMLGRHSPLIEDLLALKRDGEPSARKRLIEAYLRIGALRQAEGEAVEAMAADGLDARDAMRVAYALRSHAPATARLALEAATHDGLPPGLAGPVLSLAARLGLEGLQGQAMRLMTDPSHPEAGRVIKVDDLAAFLRQQAGEYRLAFAGWLEGRQAAAVAMHADLATFARLFLAEPADRLNGVGDPFPMLVRSGAVERRPLELSGDRPPLRVELSALLIAGRFGLLPQLEAAFEPIIPPSAAEALVEIEAELGTPSPEVLSRCGTALAAGADALLIVDEVPGDLPQLEREEEPHTLDLRLLGRVVHQAFLGGHVDRGQVEALQAAHSLPAGWDGASRIDAVALSPFALASLADSGMLHTASRGTVLTMSRRDAERSRRDVAAAVRMIQMRDVAAAVRTAAADGVLAGRWRTLPATPLPFDEPHRLAAHVRCLMETLAVQEKDPAALWIEDRAVTRNRTAGMTDVPEVLEDMARRGFLTKQGLDDVRQRIMAAGYNYQWIDPRRVADLLIEAPVTDHGLIETPMLAQVRRWFADEVQRAMHLDRASVQGADGSVGGEMRHLVLLEGLSNEVLARIWANTASREEERAARSEWVWTCLRSGRSPLEDAGWEAVNRRGYAACSLAQALMVALFTTFRSSGMKLAERHAYVDWTWQTRGEPLVRASPDCLGMTAEMLAVGLVSLVEGGVEDGGEAVQAQRIAMAMAKHFLDLLPAGLRGEVEARHSLHERLGLVTVSTIDLGGHPVPLSELAESPAFSSGDEPASRSHPISGTDCEGAALEVVGSGAGRAVALVAGDERTVISPVVVALLLQDETERVEALCGMSQLTSERGTIATSDLERVGRLELPERRFDGFQELLANDLHQVLSSLANGIRERRSIGLADLGLPAPAAIAAYLGVEHPDAFDVGEAFGHLGRRVGGMEAARRLAGLPACLPSDVLIQLGQELATRHAEAPPAFGTPPLARLAELRARLAAGGNQSDLDGAALAFAAAVGEAGHLFVALVRRGAELASRDAAWDSVGDRAFVSLVWAYAEQVTHVLIDLGGEPDRIGRWLSAQLRRDAFDRFEQTRVPAWVRRLTFDLSVPVLAAAAVSSVIAGASASLGHGSVAGLQALCGHKTEGGPFFPALATLAPPPPGPADLWAARDALPSFIEAGWMQPTSPYASREHAAIAGTLLSLEAEWREQPAALLVLTTLDPDHLSPKLREEVQGAMLFADASLDLEPDRGGAYHLLNSMAALEARRGEPEGMSRLLGRHAARCAARWPRELVRYTQGDQPWERAFGILADASLQHAVASPGSQAERMAIYARNIEAIDIAWPAARQACISALDAAARSLDPDAAVTVWPKLVEMRSRH